MQFKKSKDKIMRNRKQQSDSGEYKLDDSLDANAALFKKIFNNDDTLFFRYFENQQQIQIKCCILFINGMVNNEIINENVIRPIVQNTQLKDTENIIDSLKNQVIISNAVDKTSDVDELAKGIILGNTVLFLEGSPVGLIISTIGWKTRQIVEPESERVTEGPREGFNESIMMNLSMIRRRLETPGLKMKFMTIGVQTHTKVCICYIEGIVNHKILDEVYKRLSSINIDGILDAGYISELIRDSPYSPFRIIGSTERPDVVAGKLLEGRIAVVSDGTPVVLTVPFLFIENFQSNEDYFTNYYLSSVDRMLRVFAFWISISIPAIYVALVTFHQETIPTPLLLSISASRQGVPFPSIVETILLLLIFEMLRETGVRMPSNIGQALSIVGALVLGTASIEAKIVSAPVVIVVSVTAITGLMLTRMKGATIILRAVFLLLSAFVGLYGYIFGIMGLLLHLCEMRSFGIPYMLELTTLEPSELKDTAIRAPWWHMKQRPELITTNRVRQAGKGKKS